MTSTGVQSIELETNNVLELWLFEQLLMEGIRHLMFDKEVACRLT